MHWKHALAAIAILGLAPAGPATAATPIKADVVRDDINRLDDDIDRADRNDTISEREAARLRERVKELRDDFQRMNANGLTGGEMTRLETRIRAIRSSLHLDRKDGDNHAG